ncbi:hypothetical protein [Geminisphaera colitermitum]|uniref:hypothetical protein n=1 Tax=Geminisphaera colitermitum TaxID=1148786 RepID=UPI000158C720|nr:hypothetical protein [Geminisphaera colitermitum]
MSDDLSSLQKRVAALEQQLFELRMEMQALPKPEVSWQNLLPLERAIGQLQGEVEGLNTRVGELGRAAQNTPQKTPASAGISG